MNIYNLPFFHKRKFNINLFSIFFYMILFFINIKEPLIAHSKETKNICSPIITVNCVLSNIKYGQINGYDNKSTIYREIIIDLKIRSASDKKELFSDLNNFKRSSFRRDAVWRYGLDPLAEFLWRSLPRTLKIETVNQTAKLFSQVPPPQDDDTFLSSAYGTLQLVDPIVLNTFLAKLPGKAGSAWRSQIYCLDRQFGRSTVSEHYAPPKCLDGQKRPIPANAAAWYQAINSKNYNGIISLAKQLPHDELVGMSEGLPVRLLAENSQKGILYRALSLLRDQQNIEAYVGILEQIPEARDLPIGMSANLDENFLIAVYKNTRGKAKAQVTAALLLQAAEAKNANRFISLWKETDPLDHDVKLVARHMLWPGNISIRMGDDWQDGTQTLADYAWEISLWNCMAEQARIIWSDAYPYISMTDTINGTSKFANEIMTDVEKLNIEHIINYSDRRASYLTACAVRQGKAQAVLNLIQEADERKVSKTYYFLELAQAIYQFETSGGKR